WDCLIPAWSFLWGMSVWDYYWYTGESDFLKQMWPAVKRNLKGAQGLLGNDGLFSAAYWNFFDWTRIDSGHKTVLHNSMLLIGAIQAAKRCAAAAGKRGELPWLNRFEKDIREAINRTWDKQSHSYPDSIHDDGKPSRSTCQHTSFLAALYDIFESKNKKCVMKNIFDPPKDMVQVGSPFALFYFYEAFLKLGCRDEIVKAILKNYEPMLEADATAVWEQFPMPGNPGGFLTRSHCHAWSSAPIYFLNRTILGLTQQKAGCREYSISPVLSGLKWAKGTIATIHGPIRICWELNGKDLTIKWSAPENVRVRFVNNDSLKGYRLSLGEN
ncbi:MAG TPA: alpha-L-rhamnosidase C-terminal domain-containing protein, partial [Methylococcales bacterium]